MFNMVMSATCGLAAAFFGVASLAVGSPWMAGVAALWTVSAWVWSRSAK
jgi:hypothetical protein